MLKYTIFDVLTVSQLVDMHLMQIASDRADYKDHIKRELETREGHLSDFNEEEETI